MDFPAIGTTAAVGVVASAITAYITIRINSDQQDRVSIPGVNDISITFHTLGR